MVEIAKYILYSREDGISLCNSTYPQQAVFRYTLAAAGVCMWVDVLYATTTAAVLLSLQFIKKASQIRTARSFACSGGDSTGGRFGGNCAWCFCPRRSAVSPSAFLFHVVSCCSCSGLSFSAGMCINHGAPLSRHKPTETEAPRPTTTTNPPQ